LRTWSDLTANPWDAIGAARPLSYFEAALEEDEVSLFWSSVVGAAAVGTFIGTWLGAGGSAAFGGYGAYSMIMRYHPITLLGVYLPYYSVKEQIELHAEIERRQSGAGAQMSLANRFAGAGSMTGGAMPVIPSGASGQYLKFSPSPTTPWVADVWNTLHMGLVDE